MIEQIYDPARWYWIVAGDEKRVWSSARAAYVPTSDGEYQAFLKIDGLATRIASFDELVDVLRSANVPPFHTVAKSTVIARLSDAQLEQALALMTVRQQERWRSPDHPAVNSDDPEVRAVLAAVGAEPAVVLAP